MLSSLSPRLARCGLGLAAAAMLVLAAPAIAAEATPEGAIAAKAMVEEALAFHVDMAKKTGEGLQVGGPIEATPKGSYYEVKVPDVTLKSGTSTMNIGTIMINATPADGGDYKLSMAVPARMAMVAEDKSEPIVITLGSQKFSGLWRPSLGMFTEASGEYGNVTATLTPPKNPPAKDAKQPDMPADPVTITLGTVNSSINMQPDGSDLWSGPQSTSVSNAVMDFGPNKQSHLTIDKLDAAVTYKKVNLAATKKMRDQLRQQLDANGTLSPDAVRSMLAATGNGADAVPEATDSQFALSNLALTLPPQKKPDGTADAPVTIRIAGITSHSNASGMKSDDGAAAMVTKANGISVAGPTGPLSGLVPTEASVNIATAAVPFKSLLDVFAKAFDGAMDAQAANADPAKAEAARAAASAQMNQAIAQIPPLLAKAGTTVTVTDTFFHAPDLLSTLDGGLKATSGAPFIFTGKLTFTLTGMDELIGKLQAVSKDNANPQAAGYAQMLILMQMSGQLDKAPDGRSRRTYALELRPDGGVLLNGADMKAVMPALMGAAPGAAPAPAPAPAPAAPKP